MLNPLEKHMAHWRMAALAFLVLFPVSSSWGQSPGPLKRTGTPGRLIAVERSIKMEGRVKARVDNIPPDLGPVLQVACARNHVVTLLPDGSLRGWGIWQSGDIAYAVPPEVKDVVLVETDEDATAALLANGSVAIWRSTGKVATWNPPANTTVSALRKGDASRLYAICSDNSVHELAPQTPDKYPPPPGLIDAVDVGGGLGTGWFAVKKDGTLVRWGLPKPDLGNDYAAVKDAVSVARSGRYMAVLRKDGTVGGWGIADGKQRMRAHKFPRALRILPDAGERIFLVQKPGNEWAAVLNPERDYNLGEERLAALEAKLKGCTSVALTHMYVLAVKP